MTQTTTIQCPACGGSRSKVEGISTRRCSRCQCVFGQVYKGESYGIVKPGWCQCGNVEDDVPYDLTVLGSAGIERRHGFYHPACRGITQVG